MALMEQGANVAGIAVIITVYNKEAFLRDAIDSVLSQRLGGAAASSTPASAVSASATSTAPALSVILCDDGSTDSSRAICAEYASRYSLSNNCDPNNDAIQS
ncbi:MAG: glycosyltransferase, partial [Bacteroidales bacterium]|nr:glycosyltransferase [Bacteroidales bacterium]